MVHFLLEKRLVHSFSEGRTQIFLVPTQKGLDSTIDDFLLPSIESLSPEDRLRIEQWKKQLTQKSENES